MKQRARELRKNQSDAEKKMWSLLRNRQLDDYKFRRQYVIGPYIVDFCCFESKLVVEVDGGQHVQQFNYDRDRTEYLTSKNYRVLRFWNHEVLQNSNSVLEAIKLALVYPLTSTLSLRERGKK